VNWDVLSALRASPRKTPLSVSCVAYFASEWRRDLDGIIKHAVDATFAFLHLNDNQVVKLEAEKLVDAKDPHIEIAVAVLVGRR
jgi:Holliday junction resolvase RusA-like endonuclease